MNPPEPVTNSVEQPRGFHRTGCNIACSHRDNPE
jgi:hypothetical protein